MGLIFNLHNIDLASYRWKLSAMLVQESIQESRATEIVRSAITQLKSRLLQT